jgi:hypothetical protein
VSTIISNNFFYYFISLLIKLGSEVVVGGTAVTTLKTLFSWKNPADAAGTGDSCVELRTYPPYP